jgi:PEP-CTERM motif
MTVSFRAVRVCGIALAILADVVTARGASPVPALPAHVLISRDQIGSIAPLVVAGDPAGSPTDNPGLHVDPNTTSSAYAGVGSLFIDAAPVGDGNGFLCSGCAIHGFSIGKTLVRNYVLSAAHCLDFAGGLDPNNQATGDGIPDVAPKDVSFILNYGGNITTQISAKSIHLFPEWHGFDNVNGPEGASVNDDVALIELSSPVPVGVPTYNLSTSFSGNVESITSVGYGESGSPAGGYVGESLTQFETIKRVGKNRADAVGSDDEGLPGNTNYEVFEADFDGPTAATNVFNLGNSAVEGTLGNNIETTIGPGDSGSPSFLSDFNTLNPTLGADGQPIVYGINTFSGTTLKFPAISAPAYGSVFGGTLVSRYASWIDSVINPVPEPSTMLLAVCGMAGLAWISRSASHNYRI